MATFLQGLLIGFSIAAPVGPIGVLCIRRSIADGRWIGFATGLGAAMADATYGCVAAFGLTAVSGFLVGQQFWLGLVGGVFLCGLGGRMFLSNPATLQKSGENQMDRHGVADATPRDDNLRRWLAAFGSALVLTLTNPLTILSFAAVFAGIGLGATTDFERASLLVGGVFTGSAAWWLVLSTGADALRGAFTSAWMRWVNRVSGVVILGFGVWALVATRL